MQIQELRFMTTTDPYDLSFQNWSRCYEWEYVLNVLKSDPFLVTVHNTACGEAGIHKQFHDKLKAIPGKVIYNSDVRTSLINTQFDNFHLCNIIEKPIRKYDCVLCISVLEDFLDYNIVNSTIKNLLEQTEKRLIITCDYPGMPVDWLKTILNEPDREFSTVNILNGSTSIYPQREFTNLNIILLDIIVG